MQLGAAEVRELKAKVPGALYTVAKREVSCRVEPPAPGEKPHMRGAVDILAAILDTRRVLAA